MLTFSKIIIAAIPLLLWFFCSTCYAGPPEPPSFVDMGIEELMNVEVTSASKKRQKLSATASAIFVITQKDIRRAGVTCLPEALRLAPGLQVARIDANKWAVGARGFFGLNGRFENKLLVLIDGRSVYTPLFSGVFWELQDVPLQDIERIEVIRGPGAALWGANAVNGVINIITKPAYDTQGSLVTGTAGTEENGGMVRHGGRAGDSTYYRLFAKYADRKPAVFADGEEADDDWTSQRTGFRVDRQLSGRDDVTLRGVVFKTNTGETLTTALPAPPFVRTGDTWNRHRGGNILARWQRALSGSSDLEVQAYYDRTAFNPSFGQSTVDTYDLEGQHRFSLGEIQEIVWGGGYRHHVDRIDGTYAVDLTPGNDHYSNLSTFLQDDITLLPDRLNLILGAKLEQNDFTGLELQPNTRLIWQADARQSVWTAVSQATRTPSRGERNSVVNFPLQPPGTPLNPSSLPLRLRYAGNPDIDSERLTAYEMGYRAQLTESFSWDLALFRNEYDDVRHGVVSGAQPASLPDGTLVLDVPIRVNNALHGSTYGFEMAADWRVSSWWRLQASYAFLEMDVRARNALDCIDTETLAARSPLHQWSLRSSMNLGENVEFDLWARYAGKLKAIDGSNATIDIDDFLTLDARLGWKPTRSLEVALVGQNLLDDSHPEFASEIFNTLPTEVQRAALVQFTYTF